MTVLLACEAHGAAACALDGEGEGIVFAGGGAAGDSVGFDVGGDGGGGFVG